MLLFTRARARLAPLLIPTLVLAVLIHEFLTTPIYTERELTSMREKAVALAARGEADTAIEQLRALSEINPKDTNVWGDYLAVLIRAGHGKEAVEHANTNPHRALPDYALAELFAAALQLGDVESARAFAAREVEQSADAQNVATARARTLKAVEAPREHVALDAAPAIEAISASSTARLNPLIYKNRIASAQPNSPKKKPRASPINLAMPNVASVKPQASVESALAEQARSAVGEAEQAAPAERVVSALTALIHLDRYEHYLIANDARNAQSPSIALRNERLDRVRALTLANRLDQAAVLFESLGGEQSLPLYGLMNGADLYARRREPERAGHLIERAERLAPNSPQVLQARFYNQLDLEKYNDAQQTLETLKRLAVSSNEKRDARTLAAMFAAYRSDLRQAQRDLEKLRNVDPKNVDAHLKLAQIYRWRGWPQRALDEYRAVEPMLADPTPAQIGSIESLIDLHQFTQAHDALYTLAVSEPNHPDVIQARENQRLRNLSDYSATVLSGQSRDSPVTGNADLAFEQRLYLPPISDRYRVFAHQRYDWADLPEGKGSANRMGIGGDFRSRFFDGALELNKRNPDGDIGGIISGEWKPNDNWSVFSEVQSDSAAVPLRALHAGIEGESLALGAGYRANEISSARLSYSHTRFSDGNDRDVLSGNYRHTLYRTEKHQLSAIAQTYYATNTADSNVIYYNPSSELAVGATLEYSGILARRYERSWSQRLAIGAGDYSQHDFGSGAIWDAEYEQRLQFSKVLSVNYGVLYKSRLYDGNREGYSALFTGINWRF